MVSALLWCVGEEEDCCQGTQVPQLQGLLVQLGKLNFAELGCFKCSIPVGYAKLIQLVPDEG